MSKYVNINTDGTNAFYDSDLYAPPSGALSVSDADYKTFFSNNGKYRFVLIDGAAVLQDAPITVSDPIKIQPTLQERIAAIESVMLSTMGAK